MLNAFLKPAILLFLCTLPVWVLLRLLLYKTRFSAGNLRRETAYFVFYSYLVLLAAVTVLPVEFSRYNNLHTRGINLVPVKNSWIEIKAVLHVNNPVMILHAMENLVGNILLFIPMGFLLPALFTGMRRFGYVVLAGCLVSVSIESTQWLSRYLGIYRFVDIDDVLLNTLGTAAGYLLFRISRQLVSRMPSAEPG
jgi:glycopeptide antibiotics resistance protein